MGWFPIYLEQEVGFGFVEEYVEEWEGVVFFKFVGEGYGGFYVVQSVDQVWKVDMVGIDEEDIIDVAEIYAIFGEYV